MTVLSKSTVDAIRRTKKNNLLKILIDTIEMLFIDFKMHSIKKKRKRIIKSLYGMKIPSLN